MWEALTQKQKWGYEYIAKQRNESLNATRTDWTGQEVAAEKLAETGDAFYKALENYKWGLAKQMFDQATPEQQNALLAQFGIPDVLT